MFQCPAPSDVESGEESEPPRLLLQLHSSQQQGTPERASAPAPESPEACQRRGTGNAGAPVHCSSEPGSHYHCFMSAIRSVLERYRVN